MLIRLDIAPGSRLPIGLNDTVIALHDGNDQPRRSGVQEKLHACHGYGILQGKVFRFCLVVIGEENAGSDQRDSSKMRIRDDIQDPFKELLGGRSNTSTI